MRVCIDPGHGGRDPGAVGVCSKESTINLAIAAFLTSTLESTYGFEVISTRRAERTLSLGKRIDKANRKHCGLFVSVHCNGGHPSVNGIETFSYPGSETSRAFSESIQHALVDEFPGHRNRKCKTANFKVLRETRMPAVLVECEFITNPEMEEFLIDPRNQLRIAQAIARGIESAYTPIF